MSVFSETECAVAGISPVSCGESRSVVLWCTVGRPFLAARGEAKAVDVGQESSKGGQVPNILRVRKSVEKRLRPVSGWARCIPLRISQKFLRICVF